MPTVVPIRPSFLPTGRSRVGSPAGSQILERLSICHRHRWSLDSGPSASNNMNPPVLIQSSVPTPEHHRLAARTACSPSRRMVRTFFHAPWFSGDGDVVSIRVNIQFPAYPRITETPKLHIAAHIRMPM
ncbi:hypothetical protein Hypma_011268 [Hypsizygus marmoreus]|uniref:Uncharacterized protein n=1 Tax=Hypsizygus marmoreus TaxID=39966 RepID=A0A369JHC5_HYPMA|nr:hypothetical protein Hypma_011268 [Hypsizygus marmoreus]